MLEAKTAPVCCAHCGQKASSHVARSNPQGLWFCCTGCEAVHKLLTEAGLSKYYQLKEDGYCFRPSEPVRAQSANFEAWDSPEREATLFLEGIHCTACLWLIEKLPQLLPMHVESVRLNLGHSLLHLKLAERGQLSAAATKMNELGYRPHWVRDRTGHRELRARENRRHLIDLGLAGALAGNIMLMSVPPSTAPPGPLGRYFEVISGVLALGSVFYAGRSLLRNSWIALKERHFSIDIPITFAILVALGVSWDALLRGSHTLYFDSLSSLIFLLLSSRYLLARIRQYGIGDAMALGSLAPAGPEKAGEWVTLRPEQRLSFDGVLREGGAFFDASFLTGESLPAELRAGELVFAGYRCVGSTGAAPPRVEVTHTGESTRLAQLIEKIRSAQPQQRSRFEHAYDRWAQHLIVAVAVAAFLTLGYQIWQGRSEEGIQRMLALLIVTCPCALALAAPLTVSLGIRWAARQGLIIKDSDVFEKCATVKHVFFDKTGTLTEGRMSVESNSVPVESLPLLKALARSSMHPVSRAICLSLGDTPAPEMRCQEIPGMGVRGEWQGQTYELRAERSGSDLERGLSRVALVKDAHVIGVIELSDTLRPEGSAVVHSLLARGLGVSILSGDRVPVVHRVATELGLKGSESRGELSPEQKAEIVESREQSGTATLVAGDGVNDALALSKARVSVAVQGSLEAALQSCQVYSMLPGVTAILRLFRASELVNRQLRRNFFFSTFYNFIAGTTAILGHMTPLWAAVLMPMSAMTVFTATLWAFRKGAAR